METWNNYYNRYYGPKTGYYANTNGIRSEYRAWQERNIFDRPGYTPYPVYRPSYFNTNDRYISHLERANSWFLYKSVADDVDAWGYPRTLSRRDDGNRIRRARFERMYGSGVFQVLNKNNIFMAQSELRAFIDEDRNRRFNNLLEKGLPLDFVSKGKSEWVEEIDNGRRVKKLYIGSEGGLDMDGSFNPRLVRRAVRSVDIGMA